MAVDHNNPQSRDEEILIATIDGKEYNKNPQSRMEELLLELKETIEEGGGGGGTTDYENLSNQPQVNGETLIGDKSGADLGLVDAEEGKGLSTNDYDDTEKAAVAAATSAISAMKDGSDIDSFGDVEVALLDKQDELTAGKYIQITNDEISVKRDIAYEADEVFFAEQTNKGLHVSVTIGSTTLYDENFVTSDPNHTVLDLVQTSFSVRAVRWVVKYLKASKTRSAGTEETVWPSITDTFVTTVDADKKLIIQSEMDAAINSAVSKCYHHAGTKTVAQLTHDLLIAANEGNVYEMTDSGTTTSDFMEGIGHQIKAGDNVGIAKISDGVYKFDLLSGFVDTTNFVQKSQTAGLLENDGTVNTTIEGDVSTLKSGLTDLSEEVNGDATTYPYADVITIPDAVPANVADCNVKIEPVQDLHGYDHPWVGGAYKNKCFVTDKTIAGAGYVIDNATINDIGGLPVGTYAVSFDASGYASGGAYECILKDANGTNLTSKSGSFSSERISFSLTIADVAARIVMYTNSSSGVSISNIQIESGETATDYAPYTNICPITGHTEASVQRDGVNQWDEEWELGGIDDTTGEKTPASIQIRSKNYIQCQAETSYYVASPTLGISVYVYFYGSNQNFIGRAFVDDKYSVIRKTITTPENCAYMMIKAGTLTTYNNDISINYPSTNTEYAPYKGQTYTIALGDTIYGGTVDFDSGVMKPMWASEVFDGTQTVQNVTRIDNVVRGQFVIQNSATYPHAISSYLEWVNDWGLDQPHFYIYDNKINVFLPIPNDGTSTWDSYLASNPLQVCYPLATPTTIQLTPQQIQLLKGTNTITASTGDISVTVNGVSGSIGQVQEQVNELAEDVADVTADVAELDNVVQKQTTFTTVASKWYKIGSISISSARYQLYQFIIAFNGHLIKHVKLRCVPTNGYNSQETKVEQIFGTDNSVGLIISNDYLTVDIYIKTEVAGNQSYQILTKGGEQPYAVFSTPSVTDLSDSDMSKLG